MQTVFPQLGPDENDALEKESHDNCTGAAAIALPLRIARARSVRSQEGNDGPRRHRLKMLAMKELRVRWSFVVCPGE